MPSKQPELPSVRVERTLRRRIADGTYRPNSQLPPMDDIAKELKVSRGTVAAVLRKLAAEDPPLVRVIPGYGSFVAPSPTNN